MKTLLLVSLACDAAHVENGVTVKIQSPDKSTITLTPEIGAAHVEIECDGDYLLVSRAELESIVAQAKNPPSV